MPVILKTPKTPLVMVTPVGDGWRIDLSKDLVPSGHGTAIAELGPSWNRERAEMFASIIESSIEVYREALEEQAETDGTEEERESLLYPVTCPGCGADFKIELAPADAVQPDTEAHQQ